MGITSMSPSELYKTLTGRYRYDLCEKNKEVKKQNQKSELKIPTDTVNLENLDSFKNNSYEIKKDQLELSSEYLNASIKMYTNEEDYIEDFLNKFKHVAYDVLDDSKELYFDFHEYMGNGYGFGLVTNERIAEYYGTVAKRLDEAYKEGKFTDEEYDELNQFLEKELEKEAVHTERMCAFYNLSKEQENALLRKSTSTADFLAKREELISEIGEKEYKIDRSALIMLFNNVRYGG